MNRSEFLEEVSRSFNGTDITFTNTVVGIGALAIGVILGIGIGINMARGTEC